MSPQNILMIIVSAQGLLLLIAIWLCIRILLNRINLQQFKDEIKNYSPNSPYDGSSAIHKLLKIVKNNTLKGRSLHHDELAEIVYLEQTRYDSWINSLVNSEIILGLFGTFLGIILSLSKIDPSTIVGDLAPSAFIKILTGQIEPFLKGIDVAFGSSLSGIICTLLGRFIFQAIRQFRERNIREVLVVINSELLPITASERPEDKIFQSVENFSKKVEDLTGRIEAQLKDFNTRFDDLVQKTTGAFEKTFTMIVDENKIALDKQVETLQESTASLNETRRDIANKLVDVTAKSEVQVQSLTDIQRRIKEEAEAFETAHKDYHQKEEEIINRLTEYSDKQKELMDVYGDNFKGLAQLGQQAVESQKKTNETLAKNVEKIENSITSNLDTLLEKFKEMLFNSLQVFDSKHSDLHEKYKTTYQELDGLGKTMTENVTQINQKHFEVLDRIETRIFKNIDDLNDIFQQKATEISENLDKKRKEMIAEYTENLKKLGEIGQTSAKDIAAVNQKILETVDNVETRIAENQNELARELSEKLGAISTELDNKHKQIFDEYKKHLEKLDQLETLSEKNLKITNERIFEGTANIEKKISDNFNQFSNQLNQDVIGILEKFEKKHRELQTNYKENFQALGTLGNTYAENIKEIRDTVFNSVEKTQTQISNNMKDISEHFNQNLDRVLNGFDDRHKKVSGEYEEHLLKLHELGELSGRNLQKLEETIYKNLGDIEKQIIENIAVLTGTFKDNLEKVGELNQQFPPFIASMQETAGGIKATVNGFDQIVDKFKESISNDVKGYFDTIETSSQKLDQYFEHIKGRMDTFGNIQEYGNTMMDRFDGTVKSFSEPLQEFQNILDNFRLVVNVIQEKLLEKQEDLFKKIMGQKKIPVNFFLAPNGHIRNTPESEDNSEQKKKKTQSQSQGPKQKGIKKTVKPNRTAHGEEESTENKAMGDKGKLESETQANPGADNGIQKKAAEEPKATLTREADEIKPENTGEKKSSHKENDGQEPSAAGGDSGKEPEATKEEKPKRGVFKRITRIFKRKTPDDLKKEELN
jgi:ABC-type transporter Mla subunit MlaD